MCDVNVCEIAAKRTLIFLRTRRSNMRCKDIAYVRNKPHTAIFGMYKHPQPYFTGIWFLNTHSIFELTCRGH